MKKIVTFGCLLLMEGLFITAACTPESPPLKPLLPDSSVAGTVSADSRSSSTPHDTAASVTGSETDQQESVTSSETDQQESVYMTKWHESEPILSVSFQWEPDYTKSSTSYDPIPFTTDDPDLIEKFTAAYNSAVIKDPNSKKTANADNVTVTYQTSAGTTKFELWGGGYFENGKRYDMEGYEAIMAVLNEIEESLTSGEYTTWNDSCGELLSYGSSWSGLDRTESDSTTDKELMTKLEEALRDVRIIGTTATEYICDDNTTIILKGTKKTVCMEVGEHGYGIDGQYYKLKGYDKVEKVLDDNFKKNLLNDACWNDSNGDLLEVSFRRVGEGTSSAFYRTDDPEMLTKLINALKGVTVTWDNNESVTDDHIVILYTAENKSGRIEFDRGQLKAGIEYNGRLFDIEGYEAVQAVLDEIEERFPTWQQKYDTWIHRMSEADNRLKEITTGIDYQKADMETRRSIIMQLLKELEEKDLIKEGSITDNQDSISFIYNCHEDGVYGSVMLKDFDPMMN